jgi:hypothetical protein
VAFRAQREPALTPNWSFKTPRRKIQYRRDLFPRHVKLLRDFLDAHPIF